jgi:UDP-N-acetylmuramate--alanine ligase
VTAEILVERLTGFGHRSAHYVGSMDRGVASVTESAASGDAIITLGAGNVYQAGDRVLAALRGAS